MKFNISNLANSVITRHEVRKQNKSLLIDGRAIYRKNSHTLFDEMFIVELIDSTKAVEVLKYFKSNLENLKVVAGQLFDKLEYLVSREKQNRFREIQGEGLVEMVSNEHYYNPNVVLITDPRTGNQVLFDRARKTTLRSDPKVFVASVGIEDDNISKELLGPDFHGYKGRIEYDPISPYPYKMVDYEGQKIRSYNTHIMPKWRKGRPINNPMLPKIFEKFMAHLFPHKESLDYVYHWLHLMLTDRNGCVLLLNSALGTGKNTFYMIADALVGPENAGKAPRGFFESRFNEELRYKRVFLLDEIPITQSNKEYLKNISNDEITIEEKGKNPQKIQNHCSFMVFNNYEERCHLDRDERRFSVPLVTDQRLDSVFNEKDINELKGLTQDEEQMAHIGYWIIKHGKINGWHREKPFITEKFHQMVLLSLKEWKRGIIEMITSKAQSKYTASDINKFLKNFNGVNTMPAGKALPMFLQNFKDEDGDLYGAVKQIEGKRHIIVNSKYEPFNEIEEEETDDILKDLL